MKSVLTRRRLSCSSSGSDQDAFANAVIRVGEDFQVNLPPIKDEPPSNDAEAIHRGILMWRPIPESLNDRLEKFLDTATKVFSYEEDQALALLTWHQIDFDRAWADLENFNPVKKKWKDSEKRVFFKAVDHYNKQFHEIKRLFPNRSVKELILFYYLYKKIRQTLQEMTLYGTKWFCLVELGFVKPSPFLPPNVKSIIPDERNDDCFDMSDPFDVKMKRHLDMMVRGKVEEPDDSDCDTENSALSTQSDSEAEVYTPYLLADSENVEQQQSGDVRNNSRKDLINPSRNRQRPCGKGRGSAANTTVLSQSSINLPTGDLISPNRLSVRRHGRFEEEIAAAAVAAATASSSTQSNGAKKDERSYAFGGPIRRSSRRGILSKRAPYDSRTRLPPGVYYSHKEFLRMCNSTPEEYIKDKYESIATLIDLSNPLDEQIKEHAEKEKEVLDGISAFKPPELPIVS
ncbi:unnamed protein product [Trichobilharzia szidati]|nr:unnamed protein product [Trichobilharzia szidati]